MKTWLKAINFLKLIACIFLDKYDMCIPTPNIYERTEGSIDLYWSMDNYSILVNISL